MIRRRFNGYYHYVYITINLINGKCYIGDHSTKNLNDHYRGSGLLILKAFKKYGKKNFLKRSLKFFSTRQEAHLAETEYIIKYNTQSPNGYNISPTGGLGNGGGCHSEDTKQKMSILQKVFYQTSEGIANRKRSKERNNVYYQTFEGIAKRERVGIRMHTPEAKAKQIASRRVFYQTPEGIKVKEETNSKISTTLKLFLKTPKGIAWKQKQSETNKERHISVFYGKNNPSKKPEARARMRIGFKAWLKTPKGIAWKQKQSETMSSKVHTPEARTKAEIVKAKNRAKKEAIQRRTKL